MLRQFPQKTKSPTSVLDYSVDFTKVLNEGETIASVVWTVPDGITQTNASNTSTEVTIWVSGGSIGQIAVITAEITTNQARVYDYTFQLLIEVK